MAAGGVLVAAGGTGGHLFPAEALAAALAKRNVAVELADRCPRRSSCRRFSAATPSIVIPSATIRGRDPVSLAKTASVLGYGVLQGLAHAAAAAAGDRGRLRRLSDHSAAACRGVAWHPDADPRAERGDGPRQPDAGAAGPRHCDRLCRHSRSRSGAGRQGDAHRQSGAAGGDRGGGDALSAARCRRAAAAPRVRRQPGRARDGRHRSRRPSRSSSRVCGRG